MREMFCATASWSTEDLRPFLRFFPFSRRRSSIGAAPGVAEATGRGGTGLPGVALATGLGRTGVGMNGRGGGGACATLVSARPAVLDRRQILEQRGGALFQRRGRPLLLLHRARHLQCLARLLLPLGFDGGDGLRFGLGDRDLGCGAAAAHWTIARDRDRCLGLHVFVARRRLVGVGGSFCLRFSRSHRARTSATCSGRSGVRWLRTKMSISFSMPMSCSLGTPNSAARS